MASINASADTTEGWWLWISLLASALQCFRGPSELNLAHIIIDLYTQSVNNYEHNSYPRKMRSTFDTELVRITYEIKKPCCKTGTQTEKKIGHVITDCCYWKFQFAIIKQPQPLLGCHLWFHNFFMLHFLHGPRFFLQFGCFCVDIYLGLILAPVVHTYQYTPTSPCKDFLCNKNYSPKSVTAHPLGCSLHPCWV